MFKLYVWPYQKISLLQCLSLFGLLSQKLHRLGGLNNIYFWQSMRGRRVKGAVWGPFQKDTNPIHDGGVLQRPHFQMPLHWRIRISIYEFWGTHKHSDCNTQVLFMESCGGRRLIFNSSHFMSITLSLRGFWLVVICLFFTATQGSG